MSSERSGPYKSRLFNFLHRQSHSLRAQYEHGVRHVQVAAVWGVQILLYPIYLIAQSARFAGHQLQQAAQKGWPELDSSQPSEPQPLATSDTPIKRVLNAVDTLPLVAEADVPKDVTDELSANKTDNPSAATTTSAKKSTAGGFSWRAIFQKLLHKLNLSQPVLKQPIATETNIVHVATNSSDAAIGQTQTSSQVALTQTENHLNLKSEASSRAGEVVRGVASLLATRTLVLVTGENEILNILTPEQQQKLSSRISWEVADYWRHRRLTQASEQQFSKRVLSSVDSRRVLPAVRVFWQVMAWVQTGPVAIATNLFQESALVKSPESAVRTPELEAIPFSSLILAPLSFIVEQLTRLDSTVAELETKGLIVPASELTSSLAYRSQALLLWLQQSLGTRGQGTPNEFSDASLVDNLRIHSLIRDAVDYFFGDRGKKLASTSDTEQPALDPNFTEQLQLGGDVSISNPKPSLGVGRKGGALQLVNQAERERGIWKFSGLGKLKKAVRKLSQQARLPQTPATADVQANKIQSLIRGAIDYFFGSRDRNLLFTDFPEQPAISSHPKGEINRLPGRQSAYLPSNPELAAADEPDPWLTLSDLFGDPTAPTQSSITPSSPPGVGGGGNRQEANQSPKTLKNGQDVSVGNSNESQILPHLSPSQISLRKPKPSSPQQTQQQRKTSFITKSDKATPVAVSASKQDSQASRQPHESKTSAITTSATDANLDQAPDWIETQATPAGYVKHPLEIVLGWLDNAMLWAEEIFVKVWRWVRRIR